VIVGLGVEGLDLPRFERLAARFGERIEERLFTADERAYAGARARPAESLAARLSAKLAARRALGLRGARWHDVEVVRDGDEAPSLRLHGEAARAASARRVRRISLSLSHDGGLCLSQVILEDDR